MRGVGHMLLACISIACLVADEKVRLVWNFDKKGGKHKGYNRQKFVVSPDANNDTITEQALKFCRKHLLVQRSVADCADDLVEDFANILNGRAEANHPKTLRLLRSGFTWAPVMASKSIFYIMRAKTLPTKCATSAKNTSNASAKTSVFKRSWRRYKTCSTTLTTMSSRP